MIAFLDVKAIYRAHAKAMLKGGDSGVRDSGLIESTVHAAENGYYQTLAEIGAHYLVSIALNHPFMDGNKRTATIAMIAFLKANGCDKVRFDRKKWADIAVGVARGEITKDNVIAQLTDLIGIVALTDLASDD